MNYNTYFTDYLTNEQNQTIKNVWANTTPTGEFYRELLLEYEGEDFLLTYYTPYDWTVSFGKDKDGIDSHTLDYLLSIARELDRDYFKRVED